MMFNAKMFWVAAVSTGFLWGSMIIAHDAQAAVAFAVVPSDYYDTDGTGQNVIPFGDDDFCTNGIRYQQLYNGDNVGYGNIGSIAFRLNGSEAAIGPVTVTGMTVKLSSTKATTATLSTVFADNIGPDETTVFNGDFTFSAGVNASPPHPFDIDLPINEAFEFDGQHNNLLLDITISGCQDQQFSFDAATNDNQTRRMFSTDKDSLTGQLDTDDYGLVTAITTSTPPPLPYVQGMSGNWAIDGHNGEGFMIEALDTGVMVVFWFTYDIYGNPLWLFGSSSNLIWDEFSIDVYQTSGPVFGPGYDPALFSPDPWGTLYFRFTSCSTANVEYVGNTMAYGTDTYTLTKQYDLEQSECIGFLK